jgi:hypothetical protein
MNGSNPGKPFYESFGFKLFVAIAIIIVFTVIFLIQTHHGESSVTVNPTKPAHRSPAIEVPSQEPSGQNSNSSIGNWPTQSEPPMAPGQSVTRDIPMNAAPAAKSPSLPLAAPVAQVHSLSEAEAVMGPASGEVGEVGVTRTYRLPGQEGRTKAGTLPADPQKP